MSTVLTGTQIDLFRINVVIRSMETHIRTGGKMRLTRMATPTNLRAIATEYTGVTYARSQKGMEQALADLKALLAGATE